MKLDPFSNMTKQKQVKNTLKQILTRKWSNKLILVNEICKSKEYIKNNIKIVCITNLLKGDETSLRSDNKPIKNDKNKKKYKSM